MTTENTHNSENTLTNGTFIRIRTMLSRAFRIFVRGADAAVTPGPFGSKALWAIEHDNTYDYHTHTVLNIENKKRFDASYKYLTSSDGCAQQQLRLLEESTPTNAEEEKIKDRTITYVTKWLELMEAFYRDFLAGVTIDDEDFQHKYDRVRGELINRTNKIIVNDYVQYMREHEEWGPEDVERFLAGDDPLAEVPESFAQSYYADMGLLE